MTLGLSPRNRLVPWLLLFYTMQLSSCTANPRALVGIPARSLLPPADTNRTSWPGAGADTAAIALGLKPLRLSLVDDDVQEIRIWVGGGIGAETDLVSIVRRGSAVSGAAGRYWRMERGRAGRNGKRPTIDSIVRDAMAGECAPYRRAGAFEGCWYRFTRKPDWRRLWDSLSRADVWALPDQRTLPRDSILVADGFIVTVELRDGSWYRSYQYDNPWAHHGKAYDEANAIAQISRQLPPTKPAIHSLTFTGRLDIGRLNAWLRPCGSRALWRVDGAWSKEYNAIRDALPVGDTVTRVTRLATVRGLRMLPDLARFSSPAFAGVLQAATTVEIKAWDPAKCK